MHVDAEAKGDATRCLAAIGGGVDGMTPLGGSGGLWIAKAGLSHPFTLHTAYLINLITLNTYLRLLSHSFPLESWDFPLVIVALGYLISSSPA